MPQTLLDTLGVSVIEVAACHVELSMPVTPAVRQVWGFLHGGATLALLESAASYGAAASTDPSVERPFGINVNVSHRKSITHGTVRGIADLDREEPSRHGGRKQFWRVVAYDEAGEVISEGEVLTLVTPLSRLAELGREVPALTLDQLRELAGGAGRADA